MSKEFLGEFEHQVLLALMHQGSKGLVVSRLRHAPSAEGGASTALLCRYRRGQGPAGRGEGRLPEPVGRARNRAGAGVTNPGPGRPPRWPRWHTRLLRALLPSEDREAVLEEVW